MAPAQAGWGVLSSDTPPGNLVVYQDYWAHNRTTHANDQTSYTIRVTAQYENNYTWQLPENVGGQANPLPLIYDHLLVYYDGSLLGDLTAAPHQLQPPVHFGAYEAKDFTITFHVRNLTLPEHDALVTQAASDAAQRGRPLRPNEVQGWLGLAPAARECSEEGPTACYALTSAARFGIVHQLSPIPVALELDDPGDPKAEPSLGNGWLLLWGATYDLNEDARVRVQVTGPLAGHLIEFLVDDVNTFLPEASHETEGALWDPDHPGGEFVLPAGRHRLLYRVHAPEGPSPWGDITFTHVGHRFVLSDDFPAPSSTEGVPWMPILFGALSAIVATFAWRRWSRRRAAGARPSNS